ncbi:putative PEP phosphonomutase [Deinococcus grandis]|uniref:Putative PEP phosphonomutase n=1 Tax=Deinococcus grandis TaxID=57498 RepID=A0A100HL05_9DEIO|nr:isocitrate lyase/phosphoenolpyruvate mutase family protein [Deinococcus grandis]BBN93817.1 carboxyvinyl-carboxyphosphonate phosphorylmutase [Deinococcus grandis]GAQ22676.1 putative PEP phosphonomutase [Deinococcus grandis]
MIRPDHARTLHLAHREGLILPNAWDAASARTLEHAGAPAIGTTSAGIAFALGEPDGQAAPVEDLLDALARIVRATSRPVTADLEGGYAPDPDGVARIVTRALGLGVAGLNLEDATDTGTLRPVEDQVLRLRAARQAADTLGVPAYLNARTDTYLAGFGTTPTERFTETVRRGRAYLHAGADSVFVPGLTDPATLRELRGALGGPVSVMLLPGGPDAHTLLRAGASRVSTGPALMLAALGHTLTLTRDLLGPGTPPATPGPSYAQVQGWFTAEFRGIEGLSQSL